MLASRAQQRRSFFYVRRLLAYEGAGEALKAQYSEAYATDADAPARDAALDALKERIVATLPERTRCYDADWDAARGAVAGIKAFGDQVLEDLWRELDAETRERASAPAPTWQEAEREILDAFIEERTRGLERADDVPGSGFVGRETELKELAAIALGTASAPVAVCVTGEAGSGKSALFAALSLRLNQAIEAAPRELRSNRLRGRTRTMPGGCATCRCRATGLARCSVRRAIWPVRWRPIAPGCRFANALRGRTRTMPGGRATC